MTQWSAAVRPDVAWPVVSRRPVLIIAAALGVAAAVRMFATPESDEISAAEIERRRAAVEAASPLRLSSVTPAQWLEAWRSVALPPAELEAFQQAVRLEKVQLAWVELFDSDAEDGDVVTVTSRGLTCTVPLRHSPTRIAIPLSPSGRIVLTGTDEGSGGGVTAGIMANGQRLKLPPLRLGQSLTLRVVAL